MKIIKLGLILAVFCVISAGLLAYVYQFTKPRIELYTNRSRELSVRQVLADQAAGRAINISIRGYSGDIEMLVGVGPSGEVTGVKIVSQHETPGLGANIVKPAFLSQFTGKTAKDPIEPKKDIDAITGATISSRAVCVGVKNALEKFQSGNN
ncbi:MAG: FMN-binding protein [Candidatus Margulisbacteria bacterium]|nr:FMN-binding protein [Candidatus Margulisiibacteriota bacterium]